MFMVLLGRNNLFGVEGTFSPPNNACFLLPPLFVGCYLAVEVPLKTLDEYLLLNCRRVTATLDKSMLLLTER